MVVWWRPRCVWIWKLVVFCWFLSQLETPLKWAQAPPGFHQMTIGWTRHLQIIPPKLNPSYLDFVLNCKPYTIHKNKHWRSFKLPSFKNKLLLGWPSFLCPRDPRKGCRMWPVMSSTEKPRLLGMDTWHMTNALVNYTCASDQREGFSRRKGLGAFLAIWNTSFFERVETTNNFWYITFGTFVGDVSWRPAFAKLVVLMEFSGQGMSFNQTAGCVAKISQLRTTIVLIRENRYKYLPWHNVIARPLSFQRGSFSGANCLPKYHSTRVCLWSSIPDRLTGIWTPLVKCLFQNFKHRLASSQVKNFWISQFSCHQISLTGGVRIEVILTKNG